VSRYVWVNVDIRTRIFFGCFALIATLVCIDGLLKGEILRILGGAIVAWPLWTFMIKGVPMPEPLVNAVEDGLGRAMSMKPGATSDVFRWAMVLLGTVMSVGSLMGVYAILFTSPENIEIFLPTVARDIRGAAADLVLLVRLGYAALFLFVAGAFGLTAWRRARG
jgi:hypothetical protein